MKIRGEKKKRKEENLWAKKNGRGRNYKIGPQ